MPENNTEETKIVPTRTRSADARTIYIDATRLARSPFDIRLHFGLIMEIEPGVVVEEEQAVIIMSPHHAKAVAGVLIENLKKWEDEYGAISVKPEAEAE